jgi:hypothetical protein
LVVTLGLALLAHGLGIVRTPKAFSHTIAEKFRAGFTQLDIGLDEAGYLFKGRREGPLGILPMFLPTEDMDKADEDLDIPFLLLAQHHSIFLPFLFDYTIWGFFGIRFDLGQRFGFIVGSEKRDDD